MPTFNPPFTLEAKFFLTDTAEKYLPWEWKYLSVDLQFFLINHNYTLKLKTSPYIYCREDLCDRLAGFFHGLFLPRNLKLCFTPKNKDSPTLRLGIYMGYYPTLLRVVKRNTVNRKRLLHLLDVVLGSAALLVAGTDGVRKEKRKLTIESGTIYYDGLSNEILRRPENVSIILGLMRFCFELFFEKVDYKQLYKKLEIANGRTVLCKLRAKSKLTNVDKKKVLRQLWLLRSFWNLSYLNKHFMGRYPLNTYTWGMFKKYVKEKKSTHSLPECWSGSPSIYHEYNAPGFIDWCKKHKDKTKLFKASMKSSEISWTGDVEY